VARGKPIVNLLPLESEERISAVLPLKGFDQAGFVFMATARGIVKKTPLVEYSRPRASGIIALDLLDDDQLIGVAITDGDQDIMLASSGGKMTRFSESRVRSMGRTARGVIGMRLPAGDQLISLLVARDGLVLTATERGYGKCTPVADYPCKGRGGQGVISIRTSARNGAVVNALLMDGNEEMMLITDAGKLVRTRVSEVSVLSRNTQGVTLIGMAENERLVGVGRIVEEQSDADEDSAAQDACAENGEP